MILPVPHILSLLPKLKNNMSTQKITQANLKKIYDVACSNWKTKIEGYSKRSAFGEDVEFSIEEVNEMFRSADEKQKNVLDKYFKLPKKVDYKTMLEFKVACAFLGKKNDKLPFPKPDDYHDEATNAYHQITITIAAIWKCEGVVLETKNIQQSKYWPWAKQHPSGFGLSCTDFVYRHAVTGSGVRLSSPNPEITKFIFDNLTPLYNKLDNQ